jgi:single-strand DNA-binding protein
MYETNVTLVGTVISRIDRRRLNSGIPVVSFRVACTERRYDRGAESWVDAGKLYASVTCWRRLAENVHASFVTGDPIIVYGRLHTREFEKDGQLRSVTEIEASAAGPDLTRCTAALTRTKRAAAAANGSEEREPGGEPAAGGGSDPGAAPASDTGEVRSLAEAGVGG